jgi:hypothetical protein
VQFSGDMIVSKRGRMGKTADQGSAPYRVCGFKSHRLHFSLKIFNFRISHLGGISDLASFYHESVVRLGCQYEKRLIITIFYRAI